MKISPDKIMHLKLGALLALLLWALAEIAVRYGVGWSIAAGAVALAWGVERYQSIRREGTASYSDMVASSVPGVALGVAVQAWAFVARLA